MVILVAKVAKAFRYRLKSWAFRYSSLRPYASALPLAP